MNAKSYFTFVDFFCLLIYSFIFIYLIIFVCAVQRKIIVDDSQAQQETGINS